MANTEGMFCFEDDHVGCVCGWCNQEPCEHDNPDNDYECVDCGARIEGWEPTDAQIFARYGQTKETAA